jgi:hypothetical protein
MLQIMIACRRTGLAFAFVRERTLGSLISCKLGYKLPPCTTRSGQLQLRVARSKKAKGQGPSYQVLAPDRFGPLGERRVRSAAREAGLTFLSPEP